MMFKAVFSPISCEFCDSLAIGQAGLEAIEDDGSTVAFVDLIPVCEAHKEARLAAVRQEIANGVNVPF